MQLINLTRLNIRVFLQTVEILFTPFNNNERLTTPALVGDTTSNMLINFSSKCIVNNKFNMICLELTFCVVKIQVVSNIHV